jgi:hypothetical protein
MQEVRLIINQEKLLTPSSERDGDRNKSNLAGISAGSQEHAKMNLQL